MNSAVSSTRAVAPVAFEDGLGERLYAVGAANEPLEVLKISNELSSVESFESALREQAARLAEFRHDGFGRVRAVERLDARSSTLVVISDHVRGVRLSEMLAVVDTRAIPFPFAAAAGLIRQLAAAVAAFHAGVPDVSHGAIGPERIVITPDGRLVVVEYVLGPALEEMHFSQERYWRELGIALPRPIGLPRFDEASDVTQLGAVALALLLGRPLTSDEYPSRVADVLDGASARTETGAADPLPAALRTWLRRTLHIEARGSFASSLEAQAELEEALGVDEDAARSSMKSFLARYALAIAPERPVDVARPQVKSEPVAVPTPIEAESAAASLAPFAPAPPPPAPIPAPEFRAVPVSQPVEPAPAPAPVPAPSSVTPFPVVAHTPAPAPASAPPPAVSGSVTAFAPRSSMLDSSAGAPDARSPRAEIRTTPSVPAPPATPARVAHDTETHERPTGQTEARTTMGNKPIWTRPWAIAAVVTLIAVTMGVTLMRPRLGPPAAAVETTGTLEIGTNPDGVAVFIDGTNRGSTPLSVNLAPGSHVLELVTGSERRRIPVSMKAGAHMSQFLELPKTTAGLGDLSVRTDPARAKVTVDGHFFGRSPVTVKDLTPGLHRVLLENESGAFSEDVTIEDGATASLVVPMTKPQAANQSGWIAIAAPADLQVYENQRLIGSSRTERIMVAVGKHDLEMVNESLGYRTTRSVEVSAGQVAIVKPEWPRGSLALNALPWAEVFVDGERVGETPIGSVSMPIGNHEIVFRHPELGERRSSAIVTLGAPTRVSIDMRTK